ncbi:WS/DGAT domain-containing protein [Streptomyces sp. PR69]|uniref:WS/DGAT domain-containing protein n=1 Tax=Streptomyces sp. PR69 TaxID=2984950 RepID=UPI002264C862|nr:WS/DGAT domain-containing protein [Streptomyces sp. PR69]
MPTDVTGPKPRSSPLDRAWFQYEKAYPRSSPAIGGAFVCRGAPPGPEELRLLVEAAAAAYPELSGGRAAGPVEAFPFDRHIGEMRMPPGSGERGLRDGIDAVSALPLPEVPWGIWVVHGYDSERFALLARGHHALFDGRLLIQMVERLFGAAAPRAAARTPGRAAADARGRRGAALRQAFREAQALVDGVSRTCRPVSGTAGLTGRVRFAWETTPLSRLRRIAARHGASVNDLYLAALAGALRAWAPERGWLDGGRPVRAHVPVSEQHVRQEGRLGNEVSGMQLRLPCREPQPARRVADVVRQTARIRAAQLHPDHGAFLRLLPARLGRLQMLLALHPSRTTVLASCVPGPRRPLDLAGRSIDAAVPLVFLPAGHAVAACLTDCADTATICFAHDDAVPSGEQLPAVWLREVELLERAEPARPGRR